MTPDQLLDFDSVPNPYNDSADNPTITVRTALKGAAQADATTRDTRTAVALLRKDVAEIKAAVARIEAATLAGGPTA